MKVLGKVCERLEGKDFELYLVDDIACSDEYVQIFEKNTIGRVPRLNKTIYTDGKTEIVSKRNVVEGKCVEVIFNLKNSTWFLKHEKDNMQLYVKSSYEGDIKTSNKEINIFLAKHYHECRNVILARKQFAQGITSLAMDMDLPFELVLAFRGNQEAVDNFIDTVKKAIDNCFSSDSKSMQKLTSKYHSERQAAFEYIGLCVPETYLGKSLKIARYAYDCLEERKIIGYANN